MQNMKICFISNYMNHHQLALCKEVIKYVGINNFCFICEEEITLERIKLGYKELFDESFCIKGYLEKEKSKDIILKADIIINTACLGSKFIKEANKKKKIVFWYYERLYKDYNLLKTIAKFFREIYRLYFIYNKNTYFLCASSYGYSDIEKFHNKTFNNHCFKWGYFPNVFSNTKRIRDSKISFLFVGRLIDWKHPLQIIDIGLYLVKKGIDFRIDIVGTGEESEKLNDLINNYNLNNSIHLIGSLPFNKVSEYYLKDDFFLFLSDRREGWGAVLNESMSYGCIPIANNEAGSTNFLVENKENGFVYSSKKELLKAIDSCIEIKNSEKFIEMSDKAKRTIDNLWNYKVAANRFCKICESLLENKELPIYVDGPMTKEQKNKYSKTYYKEKI